MLLARGERMRRIAIVLAVSFAFVAFAAFAEDKLRVPPGGDPAMACGQTPNSRAYWTEYGFCDVPVRGPGKALGLILWSHGVSGDKTQYTGAVPPFVRRLANAGWDVVRINRNNLYEHGWSSSGPKHVEDLLQRARQAKTQGYDRLIAAGQSYGGAISVEANARTPDLFYAVLATSPGHGSDAANPGGGVSGWYYTLDKQLLGVLAGQRSGRLVISLPAHDHLAPNRDSDPIWPKVRAALSAAGLPFVLFGDGMPINGHGAATTNQFNVWYGECIRNFLDLQRSPPSGETKCADPDPVPTFLLPVGLRIPAPGQTGGERWLGAWDGSWPGRANESRVVIDKVQGTNASLYYCDGAGPRRDISMGCDRYTNGRVEGDRIVVDRGNGRILELVLGSDGRKIDATHRSSAGTVRTTLTQAGDKVK
jgi:pimeloyl-ACP methyl ester carboxylesterase